VEGWQAEGTAQIAENLSGLSEEKLEEFSTHLEAIMSILDARYESNQV